ncbi:MAG TPA: NAD(P)-dependent oxidoreductase [bacterium]|nr:NAD(P)-dependent oxidoreductase [bacterium]
MRHLVTGGSGFLGWRLARAIIRAGDSVRVYDLNPSDSLPERAEFVKGDIRDRDKLFEAARSVDVIHHLAGLMPQARASDEVMREVNVEGTRNALDAAVRAGARRFVFLSSMEVYGFPERAPFNEDHPKNPIGTYGHNKLEAEEMCIAYWKEHGLETVSLRPSTLVGPGINEPTFLDLLGFIDRPPPLFPLPGGGKSRFQMTEVMDCVSACLHAAEKPGVAGEAFNIGADNTLTMKDQVIAMFTSLGKKPPRFLSVPSGIARGALLLAYKLGLSKLEPDHIRLMDTDMMMDCQKAARVLGWRPLKTNIDMIKETYEWLGKERKDGAVR